MSAKLEINTRVRKLIYYISDIEKGLIQIPAFQRDFIWTNNDKLQLFNSLKKGYPIGSILLWQPSENYGYLDKIGPYTIPTPKEGYYYILDGFQRLSTLFGCLTNPNKTTLVNDNEKWQKEYKICYDLDKEEFFIPRKGRQLEFYQIQVYRLIDTKESFLFQRELFGKDENIIELYLSRFEEIGNTLASFNLPSIDIYGGEISEAIDIFWRLNSKGSTISQDWIVSARTYSSHNSFRLGSEIDNLLQDLSIYNFSEIKRELVLQCIQSSFGKIYFDQKIEDLVQEVDFIEKAKHTISNIKKAVQFLFEELLVLDSRLLPANIQLVFITEFFNKISVPNEHQLLQLKRWFWKTTYSNYFTVFSPSKRKEAFNYFQQFLLGIVDDPFYNDSEFPFSVSEFPSKILFGSVRAKAVSLFLLNHSNSFNAVKVLDVEGFKLSYLFPYLKNYKDELAAENAILTIIWTREPFQKSRNMAFLLEDLYHPLHEKYFLNEEMTQLFHNDLYSEILALRKKLIVQAEKNFVEELGLSYEDITYDLF